jgi:glycosyltransferase involved in cell wall biosynthesis
MKILICWMNIAGYTAACWKALAARPGVHLHVICLRPTDNHRETKFQADLLDGVSHQFLSRDEVAQPRLVADLAVAERPDVVILSGWAYRCFSQLPDVPALASARFILAMDTPWRGDLRQRIGLLFLSRYAQRMDAVLVAGEKARGYARRLGVPDARIHPGLYAYDETIFNESVSRRRMGGDPRMGHRFLFVGRYAPEKSIDVLLDGYATYRRRVDEPWALDCCGTGDLKNLIAGATGVTDLGFVQPSQQADVFANHSVLVLPSRYEPWGVVVAEAMATAMPVICTTACGAAAELMRPYTTGIEIPPGDEQALAEAFKWMHVNQKLLPELGESAMQTARPFGSNRWAERLDAICRSVTTRS